MLEQLIRNWWAVGLRGVFAILLGIVAFVWPGITLQALVYSFGIYSIVDGGFAIVAAGTSTSFGGRRGWMLFEGVLSIIAGILALAWPTITALILLLIIAAYAFVTGIFEIATAFQFGNAVGHSWLMGLSGVLSIAFSIALVAWPANGLLSLVWLIGFYGIFFGFMLIGLAYQLYKLKNGSSRLGSGITA